MTGNGSDPRRVNDSPENGAQRPVDVVYLGPHAEGPVTFRSKFAFGENSTDRNGDHDESAGRTRLPARREVIPGLASRMEHAGNRRFAAPPQKQSELHKLHVLLHGRYTWAILLAMIFAAGGVYGGWRLGQKTFRSTGLITVTPVIPTAMYHLPDKEISASFQEFMDAQVEQVKAQRVLDMALEDPSWVPFGRQKSDEFEIEFAKNLDVIREGEVLLVKYTDPDPQAAAVAVQSVMNAYKRQFEAREAEQDTVVVDALSVSRDMLQAELKQITDKVVEAAGDYGPEGILAERQFKLLELQELQRDIDETLRAQANPSEYVAGGLGLSTTRPVAELTPDDIVNIDPPMQRLYEQKMDWQNRLAALQSQGMGPNNQQVLSCQNQLSLIEKQMYQRLAAWKTMQDRGIGPGVAPSPEQIKSKLKYLQDRKNAATSELRQLTGQIAKVEDLTLSQKRAQEELTQTEDAIHQHRVEGRLSGRVHVDAADRPLKSFRDTRVTFGAAGGLTGVLMGFGAMLLLGFTDKRVRHPHVAAERFTGDPVLGMLPLLPKDFSDPEQVAQAAHSVHEIRTMLQVRYANHGAHVFGITSSLSGSGKTSLTLALGVSFAAADCKTLLIDCDLVGAGLSTRVDAMVRRKIGRILTRNGHVTEQQLKRALSVANGSRRRVGEVLVELGYVTEEEVESAAAAQAHETMGIVDVINGDLLESCVAPTGVPGLSILPVGTATAHDASRISPAALRRVIEAARAQYDIVLVDTGPVPGSLEASATATQVDAMVLTVARGDNEPTVQRSISHLRSLGAQLAGLVFNRVRPRDMDDYEGSRRSSAAVSSGNGAQMHDSPESARLGPVARAVASFAPRSPNGSTARRE